MSNSNDQDEKVRERPGWAIQRLVASLERALASSDGVTIESPKRLRDKDTDAWREHDVVITRRDAHHTIVTAIEVKDLGRKVGVPGIEGFAKKCEKTGIHHPVMVSASGFTSTALAKAQALGIACMQLAEVERFDWMATNFFVRLDRHYPTLHTTVMFDPEALAGVVPELPVMLADASGTEMTAQHLVNVADNALKQNSVELAVGVGTPFKIRAETAGWTATGADGVRHPVSHLISEGTATLRESLSPLQTHSYVGEGANYAAASTDVQIGKLAGKIMFIRDDSDIRVIWTLDVAQP